MIDWDRVNELREEIGAEDFREVVDMFLEEVDEIIECLTTAPNPAKYEQNLHFLKGSALNLGFKDFATLCADGEHRAANGQQSDIEINAVITCYQASKSQFETGLKTEFAA